MKITSEELAKTIGIKIGNRIKFTDGEIAKVVEGYQLDFPHSLRKGLQCLIDEEFEIVKTTKAGDLICKDVKCAECPLRMLRCRGTTIDTLYKNLEKIFAERKDEELYNFLKARLDREV